MAVSHVQPLLLLLASLFFLPVLCTIKFEYCNKNIGYEFGNITRVAINTKDEDTTIIVYGNAKRSLKEGSVSVSFIIGESEPIHGSVYFLNEVVDALPIKSGSNYVLTLTQVPLQVRHDKIVVTLFDEEEEEEYIKTGESLRILCINFNPHSSTTSAALSE